MLQGLAEREENMSNEKMKQEMLEAIQAGFSASEMWRKSCMVRETGELSICWAAGF